MDLQRRKFTYQDYLSWPQDERWEIIDGTARYAEVAVLSDQYRILVAFAAQFHTYLLGYPNKLFGAPVEVCLPLNGELPADAVNVVCPDMAVFDKELLDGRCCKGIPTLIAEMLTPASLLRDTQEKFQLYEQAGVPEYWLIQPETATVMVFQLTAGKYGPSRTYSRQDELPVGFAKDFRLCLAEIFDSW